MSLGRSPSACLNLKRPSGRSTFACLFVRSLSPSDCFWGGHQAVPLLTTSSSVPLQIACFWKGHRATPLLTVGFRGIHCAAPLLPLSFLKTSSGCSSSDKLFFEKTIKPLTFWLFFEEVFGLLLFCLFFWLLRFCPDCVALNIFKIWQINLIWWFIFNWSPTYSHFNTFVL